MHRGQGLGSSGWGQLVGLHVTINGAHLIYEGGESVKGPTETVIRGYDYSRFLLYLFLTFTLDLLILCV